MNVAQASTGLLGLPDVGQNQSTAHCAGLVPGETGRPESAGRGF